MAEISYTIKSASNITAFVGIIVIIITEMVAKATCQAGSSSHNYEIIHSKL